MASHEIFEKNSIVLAIAIVLVVSIAGLVEIVPLYFIGSTIEKVDGMRPYTPRTGGARCLCARRLLPLPFTDDPSIP